MQDVTFHSSALNRDMTYRVVLPAKIIAGQKLPVVYLLHGGDGGGFRDWSNESEVAAYAARNLILVMPEGAYSYYMNAVERPEDRYEDYVLQDLIADVANRFPASDVRESRAIVGISMGGFAAIKWALSLPDLFVFVGALSPSIEVLHRNFKIRKKIAGMEEWWRLRTIFGPPKSEARQSSDPFVLVESAHPDRTPYIYFTVGEQERFLEPNRRFARRLQERKFRFEFHTSPGIHNWSQWHEQIPDCFDSLLQHLEPTH
jgi:S-formylglutathione hydrolase FrmB